MRLWREAPPCCKAVHTLESVSSVLCSSVAGMVIICASRMQGMPATSGQQ